MIGIEVVKGCPFGCEISAARPILCFGPFPTAIQLNNAIHFLGQLQADEADDVECVFWSSLLGATGTRRPAFAWWLRLDVSAIKLAAHKGMPFCLMARQY